MARVSRTRASVPGKVLIVGGYLVLDRLPALVVATDSRVACEITAEESAQFRVVARSPQFTDAIWVYEIGTDGKLVQINGQSKNKYVQTTIEVVLLAAKSIKNAPLCGQITITILAHNDFYSQRDKVRIDDFFSSVKHKQLIAAGAPFTRDSISKIPVYD